MAQLSARGLVRYLTAGPAMQRKILYDFKHPEPEGTAQAGYYREFRATLARFHKDRLPVEWMLLRAGELELRASRSLSKRRTRLAANARAIRNYCESFPESHFTLLPIPKLRIVDGDVAVRVRVDFRILENGAERLVILLPSQNVTDDEARLHCNLVAEAAARAGLAISPRSVRAFVLHRGRVVNASASRTKFRMDLDAALKNIAGIWPTIAA
jgi:hypothetical protein